MGVVKTYVGVVLFRVIIIARLINEIAVVCVGVVKIGVLLCRSPRKGLMSPKQPVSNVRRVFGFDAPFDANSGSGGSGGLVSEGRKVPNGTPSTILYPTPPSQGATTNVQGEDSTPHSKPKRKSSPPINTPHHFSRH